MRKEIIILIALSISNGLVATLSDNTFNYVLMGVGFTLLAYIYGQEYESKKNNGRPRPQDDLVVGRSYTTISSEASLARYLVVLVDENGPQLFELVYNPPKSFVYRGENNFDDLDPKPAPQG